MKTGVSGLVVLCAALHAQWVLAADCDKGVLDEYTLADGTPAKSNYQELQSWAFLESFRMDVNGIVAVDPQTRGL